MKLAHKVLRTLGKVLGKQKLSILIYHQVLAEFDPMRPDEPTVDTFNWHMQLLRDYMTPITLQQAIEGLKNNNLPENAVCVTFDDGYINNLTLAQPILQKHNIPATVYVATAFSGGQNMFNDRIFDLIGDKQFSQFDLSSVELGKVNVEGYDERLALSYQVIGKTKYLHYVERKDVIDKIYTDNHAKEYPRRMMTSLQIQQLSSLGVEIGAHTDAHPILRTLNKCEQRTQIESSKSQLEDVLSKPVNHFAYPNGKLNDDYSLETVDIVKELGFVSAVSTLQGVSNCSTDKFQLQRFLPWDETPFKFHLRLIHTLIRG